MRNRRPLFAVLLLALLAPMATAQEKPAEEKDKKPPESPVKTAKTEVADVQVKVTEVGTVEPEVKVEVKSAISGKVIEILHRDGDVVRRGTVLARVEPDLNQAQSLADMADRGISRRDHRRHIRHLNPRGRLRGQQDRIDDGTAPYLNSQRCGIRLHARRFHGDT